MKRAWILAMLFGAAALPARPMDYLDIATSSEDSHVFVAPCGDATELCIYVLDGHELHVYFEKNHKLLGVVTLGADAQFLDVAPTDETGDYGIVVLGANDVRSFFRSGSEDFDERVLFEFDPPLRDYDGPPVPWPFLFDLDSGRVVALPYRDRIELRGLDGTLITEVPYDASQTLYTKQFQQARTGRGLWLRVDSIVERTAALPESTTPASIGRVQRHSTLSQLRDASALEPQQWPWFALRVDSTSEERVLFATAPGVRAQTYVRIRRPETRDLPGLKGAFRISPQRRYPGYLVQTDHQPDFNADGYTDLIFWNTPRPVSSLDAIARIATEGSIRTDITMHVYQPSTGLYAARPLGRVEVRTALSWALNPGTSGPLRNVLATDLDGDGDSDFACSSDPTEFSIWINDGGFTRAPRHTLRFPRPIYEVALHPAKTPGARSIAFRHAGGLYLVRVPGT